MGKETYIYTSTHDPEDGGRMYIRNVGTIGHSYRMQRSAAKPTPMDISVSKKNLYHPK
jgi:hypothetical protein